MHRNREEYLGELTQREIDLACGLKDKKASIYLPCSFFLFSIISMYLFCLFLLIYLFTESCMMQLIHHNAMWYNGRRFYIKKLDDKKKTFDFGITAVFQVTNVSSRSDKHLEVFENKYYGYLEDIIECDFNSFKIVLFEVKW